MLTGAVIVVQLFFSIVIGLYFLNQLLGQKENKAAIEKESEIEIRKLQRLRAISLSKPLSEKTRPSSFEDIVGQEEGIKALKAALCGPNPQHVIIYGPPGVGKTCAARLVLEEAKKNPRSPFKPDAKFIEMDATSIRFDERSIADPLIGSVHDPIYQGAGPLGIAGIPQPKPGAVTKAHGGVLFLDEIGELHPIQMNKLLKILEDRKVFLESAYYNSQDKNIPRYIHDIFQNGLPADFRLIGATTRNPSEIPPAIRSRCIEVFFRALTREEIALIAKKAAEKGGFSIDDRGPELIGEYASCGRDAVNIVQLAGGVALTEGRVHIKMEDIEWVINSGHYSPRPGNKIPDEPQVGYVNGLAVYGPNLGAVIGIEALAIPVGKGRGNVFITGVVDEEEIGNGEKKIRRKSTARGSIDNVIAVLREYLKVNPQDYDIYLNFPGGIPIDGPSAGISIAVAMYSAITGYPVNNRVAMTGEISVRGQVRSVGGITAKIDAALQAGVEKIIIPRENWQENFASKRIEIVSVDRIEQVIEHAFYNGKPGKKIAGGAARTNLLSASG